jgi:heat-inducible transcriptional repressor
MPDARDQGKLSPRDREILKDVILTYILSAEPVSSRLVSKHAQLGGLSAATIRNVMADLEEWGYLMQPHTSAGRVPTAAAYHLFIQSMMEARTLPVRERRYIEDNLKGGATDADQLLGTASHLLSELSSHVGVVVAPAIGETVLKAVDFVPIAGRKILCVVVSSTGFIDNKVIETEEEVPREELVRISNYLTDNFAGQTLREIRERLVRMMVEEKEKMDRVLARTVELAQAGLAADGAPGVMVDGTSMLLAKPELSDVARVRRMFEAFADKARLVRILNRCIQGGGVRVLIGEDCELSTDLEFSVVATPYGLGERPLGTLGIVGPSRMDYEKIIPLVNFLGDTLSRALAETFSSDPERR